MDKVSTVETEQDVWASANIPDSPEKIARQAKLRKTGVKIVLAVGGAAFGITALAIPFCLPAIRKVCVPYVPATPVQINSIVQCLKKHSFQGAKVIDIGSGDGRVCIACAKEGYKTTGIELNSVLWAWSNLKALLSSVRSSCSFKYGNLFKEDFSNYDAITVFGAPSLMQALEPKVAKECGEKSRLVVCRYPFLKWAPNYTYGNGIDSVWVYQKPFIRNTSLPIIYHDLVEFADHPLHPSNKPHLDKNQVKDVTEKVELSNDSALGALEDLLYCKRSSEEKEQDYKEKFMKR